MDTRKTRLLLIAIVLAGCWLAGCDNSVAPWDTDMPLPPADPSPRDGAPDQPTLVELSWQGLHPSREKLSYDLYFGDQGDLRLLVTALYGESYTVSGLQPGHTYYWRIVANDPQGHQTASPVWHLSTGSQSSNYRFPMALGNRWEYQRNMIEGGVDLPPDTGYSEHYGGSYAMEVSWVHRDSNGRLTYTIHRDQFAGDVGSSGWSRYVEGANGLYLLSESGDAHDFSLMPGRIDIGEPGKSREGLALWALSPYEPPPPPGIIATVLPYPLCSTGSWVYREIPQLSMTIQKEVVGRSMVTTPAGSFDCSVVKWRFYDSDGTEIMTENDIRDFYSDVGMVKRSFELHMIGWQYGSIWPLPRTYVWEFVLKEYSLN